jgi:multimeric flavodoxin WrbA
MKDADPCIFKDDMDHIYRAFEACDVVVFASPMYWWTITGQLLTAVDRLYAIYGKRGPNGPKKDCVLLMTAGGDRFDQPVQWYSMFDRVMGWNDLGMVLGSGKEAEARALGASIQ